jgi:uncharacterized membrane protein YkoI
LDIPEIFEWPRGGCTCKIVSGDALAICNRPEIAPHRFRPNYSSSGGNHTDRGLKEMSMNTQKLVTASMASVLVLGTLGGACGAAGTKPDEEVFAAMAAARPLSAAIRVAEATTNGKAFEGSLEEVDGATVYEITTLTGDLATKVSIDPTSGKVLETNDESAMAKQIRKDAAIANLSTGKISLLAAISTAESAAGGQAIEADLVDENAGPVFEIEVANAEGAVTNVHVDGVSGAVLKSFPAADGDHDDDHDGDNG